MGKRLISQRRGRGTNTFKAKLKGIKSEYLSTETQKGLMQGEVTQLVKDTGRNAIMAEITFKTGEKQMIVAAEGLFIGSNVEQGDGAAVSIGNTTQIGSLPEGCPIFNIEKIRGDGGSIVKSSGNYALLITKDTKKAIVKLPSRKLLNLPLNVRATVGNVSCGGRKEKPFVKAGNKFHAMKAKKILYPRVRGVAMNALDHPFGGAQHHPGKSKSTSRNAPPGRKVGAIASKRTGRRKK